MRLRSKGSNHSTSTFCKHLRVSQILHQTPQRLETIQTAKGGKTRWYQFSQNCSLPAWKRSFANYDGKRRESKSMVNVLVTCGSPMTSLFLPTVLNWELQEMLQKLNQATLKVRLSMNLKKTKVMYNEFAENVEEPNTGTPNENIVQNHLNIALSNVF